MARSYKLSAEEHTRIFEEEIVPALMGFSQPSKRPHAILVGGQPGAGKSTVMRLSMREFKDDNVVIANTDDLRAFHPQYDELAAIDDKRSAEHTHEDASGWNQMLLSRCIETKRNVLLEGVFKDGEKLANIVEQLKSNGYTVTVRFLAVHERHSIWGIHERYEREKIERGHGRFVPKEYHDECYSGLPNSVNILEKQSQCDLIEVFRRDGETNYSNSLSDKKWASEPLGCDFIAKGRAVALSEDDRNEYIAAWERVFEYMEARNAPPGELEAVKALAKSFMLWIE